MNITDRIAKELGGHYEQFILANPEIQIYYSYSYYWRDSRYEHCNRMEVPNKRRLFIELKKHINTAIKNIDTVHLSQ